MRLRLVKKVSCSTAFLMLLAQPVASALAETITIGKDAGIVWEGAPFNVTLSATLEGTRLRWVLPMMLIGHFRVSCASNSYYRKIGGYLAYPLPGLSGIGIAPRATGVATYTRYDGSQGTMSATIGLPETRGSSTEETYLRSVPDGPWCINPKSGNDDYFYSSTGIRTVTLSGNWVIVADGNQKSSQATIPAMYAASVSPLVNGYTPSEIIFPEKIDIRVSTLSCNVSTPTAVNFGYVDRNTKAGAELALQTVSLVANCVQDSDMIDANINVQFRALSGLYNNERSRLALNQGGGYITGEINGGVTDSGSCGATTGLRFDDTQISLGKITSHETSKNLVNQLTWRLCSGGSSLPVGEVTASTEMLVTFN